MIGRCDACDSKRAYATGYRWDHARAGLRAWECPDCGGPIRSKKKGETEAHVIDARLTLQFREPRAYARGYEEGLGARTATMPAATSSSPGEPEQAYRLGWQHAREHIERHTAKRLRPKRKPAPTKQEQLPGVTLHGRYYVKQESKESHDEE